MAVAYYIAKRGIQAGHSLGVAYNFTFNPLSMDVSKNTVKDESRSMNGITQTTVYRRDTEWRIETEQLLEGTTAYLNMYEFLESVDEGEVFTINLTGSIVVAMLVNNYQMQRVEKNPEWIFNFNLRVLPE